MNTHITNKTLVTLMLSLLLNSFYVAANSAEEPDLWVTSGFPYKNLVQRYDVVKIHYAELQNDGLVQCRVEFISDTIHSESKSIKVSQKQFAATPLKSCIDRDEAIDALELTFAD